VAGECALLDVISNGRMEVGLARGAYQANSTAWPAACRRPGGQALREMVPVVRAVARRLRPRRRHLEIPTSTSVPKPVQKPNPPMWIAARDPDSHNFAWPTAATSWSRR
jgi:alkanesulfonate monooxygenase SsuD/methylene tetrahydromethanopterin reductase-like flavin-dependent oxidoreductase (luciferase family)